jgi:transcription termination factor Rho
MRWADRCLRLGGNMVKKKKSRPRGKGGGGGGGGGGSNQRHRSRPANREQPIGQRESSGEGGGEAKPGGGILEMHPNGYGFLRDPEANYVRQLSDPFVPGSMIDKFGLREGVALTGMVQPGRKQQGPRLKEISDVDGMNPDDYREVKTFEQLTPITPEHWLRLETGTMPMTTRVMDLLTPLGKGQRALIVAPPRTGKTVLLQHISQAISQNHPEIKLVVLLIDERPEEVTDFRRAVNGEVVASSLDRDIESHVRLAQLIVRRCERLAEMGKDVFLLMDSITRLARAFNKWVGNTGRTMSGGIDIKAMDIPKKLFATARLFEEGGSLTIVGTALVDTGSRMDELIFQEFKGTGNMELVLDRKLADRRVWPSIDISQSGTRREEKLLPPDILRSVTMLRRTLSSMHPVDAMEQLTAKLAKFKSNQEFIELISGAQLVD